MDKTLYLLIVALTLLFLHKQQTTVVASMHFSNGSAVDIAKVEGGPAYKHTMRTPAFSQDYGLVHQPSLTNAEQPHATAQMPMGLQSFRDYLSPWLGSRDARAQSLSRMLNALKTVSESYIEAPLSTVAVVTPFRVTDEYLDALRSACLSVSLKLATSILSEAGVLVARVRGIGGQCDDELDKYDPEQFVLTVDYSRAALTILLKEECSIFEPWRVLHNTSLGTDDLSKGYDIPGSKGSRDELAHSLRELLSLPSNDEGLKYIRQLILTGESANDKRLNDALKEVLREPYYDLSIASNDEGRSSVIDPLFAASRAAALYRWTQLEWVGRNKDTT